MLAVEGPIFSFLLQVIYDVRSVAICVVLFFVLLLLFLSALIEAADRCLSVFSSEEFGVIKEEKTFNDRMLRQLMDRPYQAHTTISIVQLVITLAVVMLIFYAFRLVFSLEDVLFYFYYLIFFGLIILFLLFRGLIPKMILRGGVLPFAQKMAPLLKVIDWTFRPFCALFFMDDSGRQESQGHESAMIYIDHTDEKELMDEIVQFHDKTVERIMVPRTDMFFLDFKDSFKEVYAKVMKSGFSRIPVCEEDEDNIKGVLYVKDLLLSIDQPSSFLWQELIRPAFFVPETKKLDGMLEDFRINRVHMAIVVDEFGCPSGLVTMEDVLEEIVGEITDEYDQEKKFYLVLSDGGYIFEGKIQLNDFFRITKLEEESFEKVLDDAETLAGLLLNIKGILPVRGEIIEYKQFRFRVLDADERRVLKVKLFPLKKESDDENGE